MEKFAKNVLVMSLAPIITQLLSITITPIITRIYSPDSFGLASLFGSIVMPIAIIANLGYSPSIVAAESDEDATNLFTLNIVITIIVVFSSVIILLSIHTYEYRWVNNIAIHKYAWLMPIAVLLHGFYMSIRYWCIRTEKYTSLSTSKIAQFISENGVLIFFGLLGCRTGLLIIISGFVGSIASLFILAKSSTKKLINILVYPPRFLSIKMVAKKYSKYPRYILFNDFASRISSLLPIYILALYFSQKNVGYYALGLRVINAPMNFIGNSIGEVFFQNASQNYHNINLKVSLLLEYLIKVGLPVFLFVGLFGRGIYIILFGEMWAMAGIFSQILSLLLFIKFITLPASYLVLILKKQEWTVYLNGSIIISSTVSLIIGGIYYDIFLALSLYSITNSIIISIYGFGLILYSGVSFIRVLKILTINLFKALPLLLTFVLIKYAINHSQVYSIVAGVFILIVHMFIVLMTSKESRFLISAFSKKIRF